MAASIRNDYPIDLSAPDISPYRKGNTGVDYVTTFEAALPGPHVMVTAVVHGNEICGAIALDYFFKTGLRPRRGKLTLAFCNVSAFTAFDPADPTASRFVDTDFNRLWSDDILDGPGTSSELVRARELRPIVSEADFLLDIHSMQTKVEALVLSGPLAKGRELARGVGVPRIVVTDRGHAAGPRMRDYGQFCDPESHKNSLLVECGQHWEITSERVAKESLFRFLVHTGALSAEDATPHLDPNPPMAQFFIEVTHPVTIRSDAFQFVEPFKGLELIERAGTVIAHDNDRPVETPYDNCVLVMPSRRLGRGGTAVRLGRYLDSA